MSLPKMELRYFVLRRVLLMFPTFIGITVFAFILLRSFPNYVLASDFINLHGASSGNVPIPILVDQASERLGLNYPIPVQYFYFLQNFLTGNWGFISAPLSGQTLQVISLLLPNTMQLLIFTFIITLAVGVPLGTYIGARPRSTADHSLRAFTLIGFAMPQFFFGLLLLLIFGKGVGGWFGAVFPLYGSISFQTAPPAWAYNSTLGFVVSVPTHMMFFDALIHRDPSVALNAFMHLVLPVLTLSYSLLATIVIYLRAAMIDSTGQEYVKAAIAKGVLQKQLIRNHIRKNARIPTVTTVGFFIAYVLGAVIVVETLFDYHGIGWFIAQATLNMQIYGIFYTGIIFGIMLMIINFVIDVLYVYYDPRIRY